MHHYYSTFHSLNSLYCVHYCTPLSQIGKTKTLKLLRDKCNSTTEPELGFNLDDRCDYIDHEQLLDMKPIKSGLNVLQLNCRGIKSKLDEIEEILVQLKQPDIVILSETWLKEGEEKYVDIKGYKYEGILTEHKKGGVSILIKNSLIYKPRPDLNKNTQHSSYEHFFIEVKGSRYNVIIGLIYRPPNTDIDKFLEEYNSSLDKISLEKDKELVLGMDHNLDLLKQSVHKKPKTLLKTPLTIHFYQLSPNPPELARPVQPL